MELTLAGEALLEHARRLLRKVDDAVLAAQSVGGEVLARITALWLRIGDLVGGDGDLQEQRTAYEALFGRFVVPAGVQATNQRRWCGLIRPYGRRPERRAVCPGVL